MNYKNIFNSLLLEAINGPDQADSLGDGNTYRSGADEFQGSLDKGTDPDSFDIQGNPKVEEAMNEFDSKMGILDSLESSDKGSINQKLDDLQGYITRLSAHLDAKGQPVDLNDNTSIVANELRKDPVKLNEFSSVSKLIEKYKDAIKKEEMQTELAGREVKDSLEQLKKARGSKQQLPAPAGV